MDNHRASPKGLKLLPSGDLATFAHVRVLQRPKGELKEWKGQKTWVWRATKTPSNCFEGKSRLSVKKYLRLYLNDHMALRNKRVAALSKSRGSADLSDQDDQDHDSSIVSVNYDEPSQGEPAKEKTPTAVETEKTMDKQPPVTLVVNGANDKDLDLVQVGDDDAQQDGEEEEGEEKEEEVVFLSERKLKKPIKIRVKREDLPSPTDKSSENGVFDAAVVRPSTQQNQSTRVTLPPHPLPSPSLSQQQDQQQDQQHQQQQSVSQPTAAVVPSRPQLTPPTLTHGVPAHDPMTTQATDLPRQPHPQPHRFIGVQAVPKVQDVSSTEQQEQQAPPPPQQQQQHQQQQHHVLQQAQQWAQQQARAQQLKQVQQQALYQSQARQQAQAQLNQFNGHSSGASDTLPSQAVHPPTQVTPLVQQRSMAQTRVQMQSQPQSQVRNPPHSQPQNQPQNEPHPRLNSSEAQQAVVIESNRQAQIQNTPSAQPQHNGGGVPTTNAPETAQIQATESPDLLGRLMLEQVPGINQSLNGQSTQLASASSSTASNRKEPKIVRVNRPHYTSNVPYSQSTFDSRARRISFSPVNTVKRNQEVLVKMLLYLVDSESVWKTWNNDSFRSMVSLIPLIEQQNFDSFESLRRSIDTLSSITMKNFVTLEAVSTADAKFHLILRTYREGCALVCRFSTAKLYSERVIGFVNANLQSSLVSETVQTFLNQSIKAGFRDRIKSVTVEDAIHCLTAKTKAVTFAAGTLALPSNIAILEMFNYAMLFLLSKCNVPLQYNGESSLLEALLLSENSRNPSPQSILSYCREIFDVVSNDSARFDAIRGAHKKDTGVPFADIKGLSVDMGSGKSSWTLRTVFATLADNRIPLTEYYRAVLKPLDLDMFRHAHIWLVFLDSVFDIHKIMTTNDALGPALYQVEVLDYILFPMAKLESYLSGENFSDTNIRKSFRGVYNVHRQEPHFVLASLLVKRPIRSVVQQQVTQEALRELSAYINKRTGTSSELSRFLGEKQLLKDHMPISDEFVKEFPVLTEMVEELMLASPSIESRRRFLSSSKAKLDFDVTNLGLATVKSVAIQRSFNNPDFMVIPPVDHVVCRYIGMGPASTSQPGSGAFDAVEVPR